MVHLAIKTIVLNDEAYNNVHGKKKKKLKKDVGEKREYCDDIQKKTLT